MKLTKRTIILLLLSILLVATVQAETRVVFLNKCVDESNLECLNKTQAATRMETLRQVRRVCRGVKCPVIYSVDPIHRNQDVWTYGAWKRNDKIYFAAMPGCPNATKYLKKLISTKRPG